MFLYGSIENHEIITNILLNRMQYLIWRENITTKGLKIIKGATI